MNSRALFRIYLLLSLISNIGLASEALESSIVQKLHHLQEQNERVNSHIRGNELHTVDSSLDTSTIIPHSPSSSTSPSSLDPSLQDSSDPVDPPSLLSNETLDSTPPLLNHSLPPPLLNFTLIPPSLRRSLHPYLHVPLASAREYLMINTNVPYPEWHYSHPTNLIHPPPPSFPSFPSFPPIPSHTLDSASLSSSFSSKSSSSSSSKSKSKSKSNSKSSSAFLSEIHPAECTPSNVARFSDPHMLRFCCDYRQGPSLVHFWNALQTERCPFHDPEATHSPSPPPPHTPQWYLPDPPSSERRSIIHLKRPHHDDDSDSDASPPLRAQLGRSSFRCRLRPDSVPDASGAPVPQTFCTASNVALNLTRLAQHLASPPRPRVGHEVPQTPLFQSACRPTFFANQTGNGMDLWLLEALEGGSPADAECLAVVDHSALFMFRWHTMNVYHIHEEFIHTFVAQAMLDTPFRDFQIFHTDRRPPGLLFQLWQRAFSPGRPVLNLTQVLHDLRALRGPGSSDLLCFRHAAFNVHSGVSLFSMEKDFPTPCIRSPLMFGMSQLVLDHLAIPRIDEPRAHYGSRTKPYREHCRAPPFDFPRFPEEVKAILNYLEDTSADKNWTKHWQTEPFASDALLNVTVVLRKPNLPRQIPYQEQFLQALQTLSFFIRVIPLDFADFAIEDQFRHATHSEVLLGVHGAGLTFGLYQPTYGGLIEIMHESRPRDYPYPSIANMKGLAYRSVDLGKQSLSQMLRVTVEVILEVKRRKECFEMFEFQNYVNKIKLT